MDVSVTEREVPGVEKVLTEPASTFLIQLHRRFASRVQELLKDRQVLDRRLATGEDLSFFAETRSVREGDWRVAPIPKDLVDRRVEITGPVERKMMINALNSGARAFMADFEDSHSPTWAGTIAGQANLMDAVRRTIAFTSPEGKQYTLNDEIAVLLVRPRGWHLVEEHFIVEGEEVPASLFDFGLYLFHNAKELLANGSGPYFYLPKLEHYREARLWNEIFVFAQDALGLPQGSIRATVLIETITAAFQMEEILYELREHSSGLNCGRWDYLFSFIKRFRHRSECVFPDRAQVTMKVPFMKAYCELLVDTCHRRGAHAMGGMAAQIPIKSNPEASRIATDRVIEDKVREVTMGHDGTWVAHPGQVPVARAVFDEHMHGPNQIGNTNGKPQVTATDLVAIPQGTVTEEGLRTNIRVGLQYLESWLRGNGCVALYHLMEDAATAEICRTQIWQWIRHGAKVQEGRTVTVEWFRQLLAEEIAALGEGQADPGAVEDRFEKSAKLFDRIVTGAFVEFLTLPAYDELEK